MSFREYLITNYGQEAFERMKVVNKVSIKLARYRNHLHYFEACRKHQIIPPCLSIHTTIDSEEGLRIVRDAEIRLLLEMINSIRRNLDEICFELDQNYQALAQLLPKLDYNRVRRLAIAAHERMFVTVKKRQQAKVQAMLTAKA